MSTTHHPDLDALITKVLADYQRPEDLVGSTGLLAQLTQRLIERAMEVEMTAHLGHERHGTVTHPSGNTRNGRSKKTLKGEFGELPITVPRDRQGTFAPLIVPKHQTHWHGFDNKILGSATFIL